ncbi:hypothetical protein Misp06_00059 [Microbulbifer sp. NBRC 101763]|uniref:hypothetical protein n=1 Tax=Microbulbifer TaxID=48073 RepID=UPI00035C9FD9|nr:MULTISPECIES: hypothetical protein [Microbulbifer]WHI50158.1 hypothetical protein P3339_17150 [Microbulbifer sp. MLAF003]
MRSSANISLDSGYIYQVQLKTIYFDSNGNAISGEFRCDSDLTDQIEKDARDKGSWRATQEMEIDFYHNNESYKFSILVQTPFSESAEFKITSPNKA